MAKATLVFCALFVSLSAIAGTQWRESYFPNIPLVTQDGKKVRFYDSLIKDKVVAISFIFTKCKGPCPAETANLRQVEKLLGDRVGRDVHLYSISIDPEHDTPSVLKEYARKFNAGPKWKFLTGKKADIELLRKKLGVYSEANPDEKLTDHRISLVVGNEATGRWMKRSPFDRPQVLAQLLGTALQSRPASNPRAVSYASAPQALSISKGEDIYRSRCLSCHSLGPEKGVGPGLAGVTKRRDRSWLARWVKDPAGMIDGGDSLAASMLAEYGGLRMPNLGLSDGDVEAVLKYLESVAE